MQKGENLRRDNRPTMQQIQYLIELEKMDKKRGCVMHIANACNVSHGPVSRYLKSCCASGYLTEDYEFTAMGKIWLQGYKRLLYELHVYLSNIGRANEEIEESKKALIENIDYSMLWKMVRNDQEMRRIYIAEKRGAVSRNFLSNVLERGTWEVYFTVFRQGTGENLKISMADRGFEKPAVIRHTKKSNWLELTIREMDEKSRVDGQAKTGYPDSLKYEYAGVLCKAEMKDGKFRIPLDACHFKRKSEGRIRGMIPITVTCSVGRAHMPESTAILVFWL